MRQSKGACLCCEFSVFSAQEEPRRFELLVRFIIQHGDSVALSPLWTGFEWFHLLSNSFFLNYYPGPIDRIFRMENEDTMCEIAGMIGVACVIREKHNQDEGGSKVDKRILYQSCESLRLLEQHFSHEFECFGYQPTGGVCAS